MDLACTAVMVDMPISVSARVVGAERSRVEKGGRSGLEVSEVAAAAAVVLGVLVEGAGSESVDLDLGVFVFVFVGEDEVVAAGAAEAPSASSSTSLTSIFEGSSCTLTLGAALAEMLCFLCLLFFFEALAAELDSAGADIVHSVLFMICMMRKSENATLGIEGGGVQQ
jgi:hypothetical protein